MPVLRLLAASLPMLVIPMVAAAMAAPPPSRGLSAEDLYQMRSVDEVAISPDAKRIAYTILKYDRPGRPYSQVWIMNLATRKFVRMGGQQEISSGPHWSPDSKHLEYSAGERNMAGIWTAEADGSGAVFMAPSSGTNSAIPYQGASVAWSPQGDRIAYVSATAGPEKAVATADPIVITRYLYKPTYSEGNSRFADNRHLHIFVLDVANHKVQQLTQGGFDEHSIDWSPNGNEVLFASDRDRNPDEFFSYNLFAAGIVDGRIRRLTATEASAYSPQWSPDGRTIVYAGTRRGLTDRETTMEDTHTWLMNADGSRRQEIGASIDSPQVGPRWAADGKSVYFTIQDRGSFHLARLAISASGAQVKPNIVVGGRGAIGGWSVAKDGSIAYAFATPQSLPELYLKVGNDARKLTALNDDVLSGKRLADVESFTFVSNDNKYEVEAFLTKPPGVSEDVSDMSPAPKHPLIVNIHGGPHWANGPAFNFKPQVYAARGWATLQVNYRGSTGYGQKFADACFGDLDGNEGQDVLYGVSAAVRRYLWLDRERMGIEGFSYGGQLSDWLVTQTNEFKAAIPMDGISNLISQNYMAFYNQYEEMEFGQFLHQGNLMEVLWERSALKHVANVHTPVLLLQGENDSDVPVAEAEQFYIALKDVGVETVMVRYPREGHGLRETRHVVDSINRSIDWYEKHFAHAVPEGSTNVQP